MAIDQKAIEEHIRGILTALGDDPQREGLADTPARVARMYAEMFEGMNYTNDEIADMLVVRDIEIFSHCEHHLALMYDMSVTVAYVPAGRVIGLSKIARIADMVSRRLQLQERIGADIADIVQKITRSRDVAVLISGKHSCMSARGIKKAGAKTYTSTLRGRFREDPLLMSRIRQYP